MIVFPGTEREQRVSTKRRAGPAGDGFRIVTAGGGGHGDPRERDPAGACARTSCDGYVSGEQAREVYGVEVEHRTLARAASARAGAAGLEGRPDGVTVEVVRNYLVSVAEEMRVTLVRTAFNPVIYEVLDFGISVYDARLELVAEAPGVTRFVGANDYAIHKGVDYVGRENLGRATWSSLNYPYWSGAHTYDATLFAPVFDEPGSAPVAFLVVRAHWLDLGAKDPGYVLDSTDMHQEGLIFPGTKIVKAGRPDRELLDLIRFNSRMPDAVLGDLNAQIAALRTGERRFGELLAKFGRPTSTRASTRSSTTASGRLAARSPRCPKARGRPATGSTATGSRTGRSRSR